jgi:copper ion binding protein
MESTIERIELTAPDISCGHCVATIKQEVGNLDGVKLVEPDLATKRVLVEFDPSVVSLADITATMDEAGYPVQQ